MKTVYRTIIATIQFVIEDKISDKKKADVVTLDIMENGKAILYKQLGIDTLIRHIECRQLTPQQIKEIKQNLLQTKQAKIRRYSS